MPFERDGLACSLFSTPAVHITCHSWAHHNLTIRIYLHLSQWKLHYNSFPSSWSDLGVHKCDVLSKPIQNRR